MATPVTSRAPEAAAVPKVHRRRFVFLYVGPRRAARRRRRDRRPPRHAHDRHAASRGRAGHRSRARPRPRCARSPNHVQNLYVAPGGKELTTVRGGPLSVGSDPAVLVKPDASATATGGYKFFDGPSVEYQLCGNTTKGNCAIDQKKITPNASGALTRRMAYELALTTFHYVPEVQERRRAPAGRRQGPEGAHARDRARATSRIRSRSRPASSRSRRGRTGRTDGCRTASGDQDRQGHGPADLPLRGHGDQRQPARLPDHAAPDLGHRGKAAGA